MQSDALNHREGLTLLTAKLFYWNFHPQVCENYSDLTKGRSTKSY